MKEPFGVGEMIYRGEIYDRMNVTAFDLEFYRRWCRKNPGPILELCCGTGRLTIPLKNGGLDIMGLDICESMLATARKKADDAALDIDFVKGDIRDFDLGRQFSTILIPFNSLQHTYCLDDLESVFDRVRKHLAPGGLFIFDIFNPSIHLMVAREKVAVEEYRFTLDDGTEVTVAEQCRYDAAEQVNRVKWHFRLGREEKTERLDMRCFFPLEMDALLKYNGIEVQEKFGYYDESRYVSESAKQIYVCTMKDSV